MVLCYFSLVCESCVAMYVCVCRCWCLLVEPGLIADLNSFFVGYSGVHGFHVNCDQPGVCLDRYFTNLLQELCGVFEVSW